MTVIPIYFDHHATTPVDPRVRTKMVEALTQCFGNPASRNYLQGRDADYAVMVARHHVARLLGVSTPEHVVFTSGATESNLVAAQSAVAFTRSERDHVITTRFEHQSNLRTYLKLQEQGWKVSVLDVGENGVVDPDDVAKLVTSKTAIISIMFVQNVIGTIQPIGEICAIARKHGALVHVDAAHGLGLLPFSVTSLGVDLVSVSAHKMYGPKGAGALVLGPALFGNKRFNRCLDDYLATGTPNVPGIVGFGEASRLMKLEGQTEAVRLRDLRDRLLVTLESSGVPIRVNGCMDRRHPGNLNVSIAGMSESALRWLRQNVAFSHGSACSSGASAPSHALSAIGVSEADARTAMRMSVGRFTTSDEIDHAAVFIGQANDLSRRFANASQKRQVVNCEGKCVIVSDIGYNSFCALTNSENYLRDLGTHTIESYREVGEPAPIHIVVPSYRSSPELLARSLWSIAEQRTSFRTDVTVIINEPADAPRAAIEQNDRNEAWVRSLIADAPANGTSHPPQERHLRESFAKRKDTLRLRCLRERVEHGLPSIFQGVTSALVQQVRSHGESVSDERSAKAQRIGDLLRRVFVLFWDDDITVSDHDALETAYRRSWVEGAVVLGDVDIEMPVSQSPLEAALHGAMILFLQIKGSWELNVLAPRGMLLQHAITGGRIDMMPYGEQTYFANLAASSPTATISARTILREADHPGYGHMLKSLREYIEGGDADGLAPFQNLLEYAETTKRYEHGSLRDLRNLIQVLESKNVDSISAMVDDVTQRRSRRHPSMAPPAGLI